jgi:hypothetical protein
MPEIPELPELLFYTGEVRDGKNPGKKYIIKGSPVTVTQASKRLGVSRKTIQKRLDRGIPPEIALTQKTLPKK